MSTAIKIENVSKQYRLGVISTGTLSHDQPNDKNIRIEMNCGIKNNGKFVATQCFASCGTPHCNRLSME